MFDSGVIKKVIYGELEEDSVDRIIIFGSRARNEERPDSDTDICVVLNKELDGHERIKRQNKIRRVFAFEYDMDVDIILKPCSALARFENVVGSFEYTLLREGVSL